MMSFCKQCGTLYDPKQGPCPKCATKDVPDEAVQPAPMSVAESSRARRRAWIQLIIGIPAFIGFIYLIIYAMQLIKG